MCGNWFCGTTAQLKQPPNGNSIENDPSETVYNVGETDEGEPIDGVRTCFHKWHERFIFQYMEQLQTNLGTLTISNASTTNLRTPAATNRSSGIGVHFTFGSESFGSAGQNGSDSNP